MHSCNITNYLTEISNNNHTNAGVQDMKTKKILQKNYIYILSFLMPVIAMVFLFAINGIYPFGDRSFLHIDLYHQYFPFLTEFFRILKNGDSLLYSWNTGIGSNFLALYVYYLASPTNWLVLLCSESHLMEFISYMVIFKMGLSGFTFAYYLSKHFHTKRYSMIFFAIAYAMSGYMAAYDWNVMWLDCIVIAPIVILGLERLVRDGKCAMYCIALGFSVFTNYYLSIMLCIFLVCYFFVLLVSAEHKWKATLRFALYSLLGGGMAAILLLPELEMLRQTEFTNSTFPKTLTFYFSVFDCVARHLMDVTVETGLDHWPNIFCGVAVFILFPLYLFNYKTPIREKVAKTALLLILLASFSTNVLTFIWHGFNYPDSLPSRQSFLYILLLLTLCYEALLSLEEFSRRVVSGIFMGTAAFVLLCQKLITDDAFGPETYFYTAVLLLIYGVLIYLYRTRAHLRTRISCICLVVVFAEFTGNMFLTSVDTVSRSSYLANYEDYEALIARTREADDDFYRIERAQHITQNDAMLTGFQSASLFSSTSNQLVNQFYEKYGMRTSKVFYSNDGMTPFTSALLAVKYFFSSTELTEDPLYQLADQEGDIYLYENKYVLPLGFLIPASEDASAGGKEAWESYTGSGNAAAGTATNDVEEDTSSLTDDTLDLEEVFDSDGTINPIYTQNSLASQLIGDASSEPLFHQISAISTDGGATIEIEEAGHIYAYIGNRKVSKVTSHVNGTKKEFSKLKNAYILDLGYQPAGSTITIDTTETTDTDNSLNLIAYALSEDVLDTLMGTLSEQSFVVDSYTDSRVDGHVTAKEDGDMIFSISYEPGWDIYVDGVKTDVNIFEDTFLAIPLTEGEHTISLRFTSNSFVIGAVISVSCVLLFLLAIPIQSGWLKQHVKKLKKEDTLH